MDFFWDDENGYYVDDSDARIPDSEIRTLIDDLLESIAALFLSRAQKWYAREISFDEFQTTLQEDIKALHYACSALAFGGFSRMNQEDTRRVDDYVNDQLAWLTGLATLMFTETISNAAANARLVMYAGAGYSTYANSRAVQERKNGNVVERRHTTPGNNCDPCVEYESRGWQLIGTLPGIAQQCRCKTNCRCWFEYSDDVKLLGEIDTADSEE